VLSIAKCEISNTFSSTTYGKLSWITLSECCLAPLLISSSQLKLLSYWIFFKLWKRTRNHYSLAGTGIVGSMVNKLHANIGTNMLNHRGRKSRTTIIIVKLKNFYVEKMANAQWNGLNFTFRYSFICQGTMTRRQRRELSKEEAIQLSALPKDTTNELASSFKFYKFQSLFLPKTQVKCLGRNSERPNGYLMSATRSSKTFQFT